MRFCVSTYCFRAAPCEFNSREPVAAWQIGLGPGGDKSSGPDGVCSCASLPNRETLRTLYLPSEQHRAAVVATATVFISRLHFTTSRCANTGTTVLKRSFMSDSRVSCVSRMSRETIEYLVIDYWPLIHGRQKNTIRFAGEHGISP